MSQPPSGNNQPDLNKQRAVWRSVAKLSARLLLIGGLLFLVWAVAFAVQAGSLVMESRQLTATKEGDLGYWWVFAAIGAPLAPLGLCLYSTARRELRTLG